MFEKQYPYISSWIYTVGWIELGADEHSESMLRILNEGGMIWEDGKHATIADALNGAEEYLKNELSEDFGIELKLNIE